MEQPRWHSRVEQHAHKHEQRAPERNKRGRHAALGGDYSGGTKTLLATIATVAQGAGTKVGVQLSPGIS